MTVGGETGEGFILETNKRETAPQWNQVKLKVSLKQETCLTNAGCSSHGSWSPGALIQ